MIFVLTLINNLKIFISKFNYQKSKFNKVIITVNMESLKVLLSLSSV